MEVINYFRMFHIIWSFDLLIKNSEVVKNQSTSQILPDGWIWPNLLNGPEPSTGKLNAPTWKWLNGWNGRYANVGAAPKYYLDPNRGGGDG